MAYDTEEAIGGLEHDSFAEKFGQKESVNNLCSSIMNATKTPQCTVTLSNAVHGKISKQSVRIHRSASVVSSLAL